MYYKIDIAEHRKKQSAIRLIALAIYIMFIVGFLLSSVFIFTHIHHQHDHDGPDGGCTTCAHLMAFENLIKTLTTALAGTLLVFGHFTAVRSILKSIDYHMDCITPVRLKVKNNN